MDDKKDILDKTNKDIENPMDIPDKHKDSSKDEELLLQTFKGNPVNDDMDCEDGNPELDEEENEEAVSDRGEPVIPFPEEVSYRSSHELPEETEKIDLKDIQEGLSEEPLQEGDEEEDDTDDYYEESSMPTWMKAAIVAMVVAIIAMFGAMTWLFLATPSEGSQDTSTTTSAAETTEEPSDEETKEASKFTFFQEQQAITAAKNKLKDLYNVDEYVIPSEDQIDVSGEVSKPKITFTLELADGSKEQVVMNSELNLNTGECVIKYVSVGGKSEKELVEAKEKGKNEKIENTTETPTPASDEPVLVGSYDVQINSSVEVTLEVDGSGKAYVDAVNENGDVVEIASQDYSGGNVTTTSLASGNYTLNIYATSGCKYSWEYRTN